MEVHSGGPSTKRERLAPSGTSSSGGLEVAGRSGKGGPSVSQDQEGQSGPDRINYLADGVLVRSSPVCPLRKVFVLKSSHVVGTLFGPQFL
mgnify:CR=1 FL=1